jgi:hypothetical protein
MIKSNKIFFFLLIIISSLFVVPVFASDVDGTITPNPKYAFGENLGWINFGCDNCNVHVTDTAVTGYAWSKQYGWINLSPTGSGVTNNCAGVLGGKAWSRELGWVDFSGASIDSGGNFSGLAGTPGTKAGRINFSCTNCNVSTDWRQCSLRESPAQVLINLITGNTIPTVTANVTITNEGNINTEYQYEWCVVSDINNDCGGGDDIYYSSGAKRLVPNESWTTNLDATIPDVGTYYFKLVAHYGVNSSTSTKVFDAVRAIVGGGGGGGGGNTPKPTVPKVNNVTDNSKYDTGDVNRDHVVDLKDFSVLLFYYKKNPPFANQYVDINKDGKVDLIDVSILIFQWGRRTT